MIAGIDAGREQKDESGNCDNLLSDLGHSRLGAATVELGQLDQLVSVERGWRRSAQILGWPSLALRRQGARLCQEANYKS